MSVQWPGEGGLAPGLSSRSISRQFWRSITRLPCLTTQWIRERQKMPGESGEEWGVRERDVCYIETVGQTRTSSTLSYRNHCVDPPHRPLLAGLQVGTTEWRQSHQQPITASSFPALAWPAKLVPACRAPSLVQCLPSIGLYTCSLHPEWSEHNSLFISTTSSTSGWCPGKSLITSRLLPAVHKAGS